jgi:hypothetical protein
VTEILSPIIKIKMPPVTFCNKVRFVTLAQDGKSTQIAATLGIPRTTINSIIQKWRHPCQKFKCGVRNIYIKLVLQLMSVE